MPCEGETDEERVAKARGSLPTSELLQKHLETKTPSRKFERANKQERLSLFRSWST